MKSFLEIKSHIYRAHTSYRLLPMTYTQDNTDCDANWLDNSYLDYADVSCTCRLLGL